MLPHEQAQQTNKNGARDLTSVPTTDETQATYIRELLFALQAMRVGDFSVRMPGDRLGIEGKIADTFNEIVTANERMAQQLDRVGQRLGKEGKTKQRVKFGLASGAWAEMETSVNTLIDDLLWPTTEVTRAIAAAAQGDLLETVRLDVDGRPLQGEFLQSANIVNTMIKQLGVFTSGSYARGAGGRDRGQASAVRRRSLRSWASGKTSTRASTRWRLARPLRSATSPTSRLRWPTVTCRRRSRSTSAAKFCS